MIPSGQRLPQESGRISQAFWVSEALCPRARDTMADGRDPEVAATTLLGADCRKQRGLQSGVGHLSRQWPAEPETVGKRIGGFGRRAGFFGREGRTVIARLAGAA